MEKIYGMHKLVGLQLFWSGTPTFSSGTPTFCQMGVLNSCFQNPSESSVSAHVLLILLSELGKRDKMHGLPSILSLFRNKFNKINNTRAQMLDSFCSDSFTILG